MEVEEQVRREEEFPKAERLEEDSPELVEAAEEDWSEGA
jgi:hypothetical protein